MKHEIKKESIPLSYTKKIMDKLEEAINNDAKIIVFPELSIPNSIVKEIEKKVKKIMKDKKDSTIIVVAGSHYRKYKELVCDGGKCREIEKVYNISPVLFYKNEEILVYEQFKNNFDPKYEKKFFDTLKNKTIFTKEANLGEGQGYLMFNTELGRIAVLICYDRTALKLIGALNKKIDILIVPSWDNYRRSGEEEHNVHSKDIGSWIVLANNGEKGGSRLFGPRVMPLTKMAEDSLIAANEKSEEIKYLIAGHGIREWQNGTYPTTNDGYYEYGSPNA